MALPLASVLVVMAADRSAIVVRGKDRTSWLNGLVTCDVAKVTPGRAAYGLLVEKKGKIEVDLLVVAGEDALVLGVPREKRDAVIATLDHYLIMEDAALEPGPHAFFLAHGPRATELLREAPYAGAVDLLGVGGAVLAGDASLEDELRARARELGGAFADEAEWERVRIEHGLPRFGVEVDTTMYPQEASLETLAVSFDKGCYLGQEVVYMLQNRGHVKRKLVPLDIDGDAPVTAGAEVTTPAGESVGDVRSAVVTSGGGRVAAIAMVKWSHAKEGSELRVGERAARVRAGVAAAAAAPVRASDPA